MDLSQVQNTEAKAFLHNFSINREINRKIYQKIPEEKFDFRMIDTPNRKSDSPKESLIHQIIVQKRYILAIESGELKYGVGFKDDKNNFKTFSKEHLIERLKYEDQKMIELLSKDANCNKLIKVPWSQNPIPAVTMIWGLNNHEILHTGWNLAIMDYLNIERFPALKRMWG